MSGLKKHRRITQHFPAIVGEPFTWVPIGFSPLDVVRWEWLFKRRHDDESAWKKMDASGLTVTPGPSHEGGNFRTILTFESGLQLSSVTWPILSREESEDLLSKDGFKSTLQKMEDHTSLIRNALSEISNERKRIWKSQKTEKKILEIRRLRAEIAAEKNEIWQAGNIESRIREIEKREKSTADLLEQVTNAENLRKSREDDFKERVSQDLKKLQERNQALVSFKRELEEKHAISVRLFENEKTLFASDSDLQSKLSLTNALTEKLQSELDVTSGLAVLWRKMSDESRGRILRIIEEERRKDRLRQNRSAIDRAKRFWGPDSQ